MRQNRAAGPVMKSQADPGFGQEVELRSPFRSCPGSPGRIGRSGGSCPRRSVPKIRTVFVLIVGCGRVGSSVARTMLREGHEVSCLDEDPEAHARLEVNLEKSWEDSGGQFTVGTGLEEEALTAAGIERADAFIAYTDG